MSRLIGESLAAETMESIRKILDDHPMAKEIVELLTRYLGAHEIMVAARVELVDGLDSAQIAGMSVGTRSSTPRGQRRGHPGVHRHNRRRGALPPGPACTYDGMIALQPCSRASGSVGPGAIPDLVTRHGLSIEAARVT
jgi:hypothetical protein